MEWTRRFGGRDFDRVCLFFDMRSQRESHVVGGSAYSCGVKWLAPADSTRYNCVAWPYSDPVTVAQSPSRMKFSNAMRLVTTGAMKTIRHR